MVSGFLDKWQCIRNSHESMNLLHVFQSSFKYFFKYFFYPRNLLLWYLIYMSTGAGWPWLSSWFRGCRPRILVHLTCQCVWRILPRHLSSAYSRWVMCPNIQGRYYCCLVNPKLNSSSWSSKSLLGWAKAVVKHWRHLLLMFAFTAGGTWCMQSDQFLPVSHCGRLRWGLE